MGGMGASPQHSLPGWHLAAHPSIDGAVLHQVQADAAVGPVHPGMIRHMYFTFLK